MNKLSHDSVSGEFTFLKPTDGDPRVVKMYEYILEKSRDPGNDGDFFSEFPVDPDVWVQVAIRLIRFASEHDDDKHRDQLKELIWCVLHILGEYPNRLADAIYPLCVRELGFQWVAWHHAFPEMAFPADQDLLSLKVQGKSLLDVNMPKWAFGDMSRFSKGHPVTPEIVTKAVQWAFRTNDPQPFDATDGTRSESRFFMVKRYLDSFIVNRRDFRRFKPISVPTEFIANASVLLFEILLLFRMYLVYKKTPLLNQWIMVEYERKVVRSLYTEARVLGTDWTTPVSYSRRDWSGEDLLNPTLLGELEAEQLEDKKGLEITTLFQQGKFKELAQLITGQMNHSLFLFNLEPPASVVEKDSLWDLISLLSRLPNVDADKFQPFLIKLFKTSSVVRENMVGLVINELGKRVPLETRVKWYMDQQQGTPDARHIQMCVALFSLFDNSWLGWNMDLIGFLEKFQVPIPKLFRTLDKHTRNFLLYPSDVLVDGHMPPDKMLAILEYQHQNKKPFLIENASYITSCLKWMEKHRDKESMEKLMTCFRMFTRNLVRPEVADGQYLKLERFETKFALSDQLMEIGEKTGIFVFQDADQVLRVVKDTFPSLESFELDMVVAERAIPLSDRKWWSDLPKMHRDLVSFVYSLRRDTFLCRASVLRSDQDALRNALVTFMASNKGDRKDTETTRHFLDFRSGGYNRVIPFSRDQVLRISKDFMPQESRELSKAIMNLVHELAPSIAVSHPTIINTNHLIVLDVPGSQSREVPSQAMEASNVDWISGSAHVGGLRRTPHTLAEPIQRVILTLQPKMPCDLDKLAPALFSIAPMDRQTKLKNLHEKTGLLDKLSEEYQRQFLVLIHADSAVRDLMLSIVTQILTGLWVLHSRGIVHCDIKPENILIEHVERLSTGKFHIPVKIADFGLCRMKPMSVFPHVDNEHAFGTRTFMSPKISSRTSGLITDMDDVWSAGVMIDGLLTRDTWNFISRENVTLYFQNILRPDELDEARFDTYKSILVRSSPDFFSAMQQLISGMLRYKEEDRQSIESALQIQVIHEKLTELFPDVARQVAASRRVDLGHVGLFLSNSFAIASKDYKANPTLKLIPTSVLTLVPLFWKTKFRSPNVAMEALTLFQLTFNNNKSFSDKYTRKHLVGMEDRKTLAFKGLLELAATMVTPSQVKSGGGVTADVFLDIFQATNMHVYKHNWFDLVEPFVVETLTEFSNNVLAIIMYFAFLCVLPSSQDSKVSTIQHILGPDVPLTPASAGILFLKMVHDVKGFSALDPKLTKSYQYVISKVPDKILLEETIERVHQAVLDLHKSLLHSTTDARLVRIAESAHDAPHLIPLRRSKRKEKEEQAGPSSKVPRATRCHVETCIFCKK